MILAILAAFNLFCSGDWLEQATNRASREAIDWAKEQLKKDLPLLKQQEIIAPLKSKKCLTNANELASNRTIPLYVMISFSVPEENWVCLSKEMEAIGAVFVLRGLPNNSFKELSKRIQHLNQLGVRAPIQIDPNLFTTYQIEKVPTFLKVNTYKHDKVSGNISLAYAIEKMGGLK